MLLQFFLDEVDKDYKKLDFLTFVNLVNDPFLCAYEYLIQALPYKQNIPIMYYCDNCHSLINDNFVLCASCRIQLGSEIIKNPRKNNKHKIKTIDNELKDLKKGIISDDSEILKTYIDRRNHKKNYYKNKSNE